MTSKNHEYKLLMVDYWWRIERCSRLDSTCFTLVLEIGSCWILMFRWLVTSGLIVDGAWAWLAHWPWLAFLWFWMLDLTLKYGLYKDLQINMSMHTTLTYPHFTASVVVRFQIWVSILVTITFTSYHFVDFTLEFSTFARTCRFPGSPHEPFAYPWFGDFLTQMQVENRYRKLLDLVLGVEVVVRMRGSCTLCWWSCSISL
jgi:hypothetical protein